MDTSELKVALLLHQLRDLHPGLVDACLVGGCFKLYLLLKTVFPEAECWYDQNHVLTKIGNKFWDIRGEVLASPRHAHLTDWSIFNEAYLWR